MRPDRPAPERFKPALEACAAGAAPPNIALLRLLIEAESAEEVALALRTAMADTRDAEAKARLEGALRLQQDNPQAFRMVKSVLKGVEHGGRAPDPADGVAHWAATFDCMAQASPEGAVALYALGNPDLLRQATDEVLTALRKRSVIGPRTRVLEIGCGIGRFVAALAPEVAEVTGLDISPAMIAEAARRCAGRPNVSLHLSSGQDLAIVPDESVDLVLAADVFPYLVQAGWPLVERHVAEAARVLAPGGALVILNLSYRGDPAADAADLACLAAKHGLEIRESGARPFALWDAGLHHLVKAG